MVDDAVGAFGSGMTHQFLDDLGNGVGLGADGAGAGAAAERAQAAHHHLLFRRGAAANVLLDGDQRVAADQHLARLWRSRAATMGMFSRWMYCQMSSSVQLESGKTRMLSPGSMRPLKRFHNSGRWFLGSHWPSVSRKEKMRSLARDFSSSRRAPPKAASKP